MMRPLEGARVFMLLLNAPLFGSERLMIRTAATLKQLGADVLVATCHWEFGGIRAALERAGVPHVDILMKGEFTTHGGIRRTVRVLAEATRSALRVRRACRDFRPTHIIVPDETNFLYAVPSLVGREPAKALFVPANIPDEQRAARSRAYRTFLRRVIGRLTDLAVANSEFTRSRLVSAIPGLPVSLVPCAAPQRASTGGDAALGKVGPGRLNIVFVGQVAAHKGVDLLIDAALRIVRDCPDVDVLIAGPADTRDEQVEGWRARVENSGHAAQVRFLGSVEDVPGLMRQSAIHVMPSRCAESFGLVVLEAKQQGVPSVVFPVGALPELVRHEADGYVCRDVSADALVEGLRYFVDQPERRAAAGLEAARSAARYSVERFEHAWIGALTGSQPEPAIAGSAASNASPYVHAHPHRHA